MQKYFVILTLWVLLGSVAVQSVAAQQVLNFATLDKFSPFTWKENGQAKGIDIDIVKEMCQRMGVECNIRFYPWKRVLAYTEEGKIDGGFGAFKNPTREAFAYFLEYPVHYSTYSIFVKKGHEFPFKKIEDLYGKNIGINRGFKLNKEFDEAASTNKIRVQEVGDMAININKLMLSRIEGIAGNYHEALVSLKKMGLSDQVVSLPHPIIPPKGAYLMISKAANIPNKMQLIDKMNGTLKAMYDDGTVDQINAKYLR